MWEISIWFAFILIAINGMLVMLDNSVSGYDLISPFTNTTYTPPALPNVNNTIGNLTSTTFATNSTSGGAAIGFWDAANFVFNAGSFFVQFLYGTITGSFLTTMGLPPDFLYLLWAMEIGFFGITVLHIFTGRF